MFFFLRGASLHLLKPATAAILTKEGCVYTHAQAGRVASPSSHRHQSSIYKSASKNPAGTSIFSPGLNAGNPR
jgi:hypothetical protein